MKCATVGDADTGWPGSVWVDVDSAYLSDPGNYPDRAGSVTIFDPNMYAR